MKRSKKIQWLFEQMARIERMERGKLCRMGDRPHHNHQTWRKGRNVVRYVPAHEVGFLQEAIDGYNKFMELAQQYADEVIKQTRKERQKTFPKPAREKKKGHTKNNKRGSVTKKSAL
jgi:hypothetical protein